MPATMSSNSIRISADLFEQAQRQGEVLSRCGENGASESSDSALWAAKRAQQARDIAAIESGKESNESMSWFSGGRARRATAIDSPL